jgi:CrcB protein
VSIKFQTYLCIALGSALGGMGRYWCPPFIEHRFGQTTIPWGTVLVNISGSFLIGVIASLGGPHGKWNGSPLMLQFLMLGVCGGYTTFSSFSLQTLTLARQGAWLSAGGNVLSSVCLCVMAVWLGYLLGQWLNHTV